VVAETDASGALTNLYVRNGDELLAVMRPGGSGGMWTTRFVHADGLGSVRVLTDESGTTVDARGYEAFGTKNVEAGSDSLAYGFAGEPLDGTTHLAYHRARWMDSRVGRFEGMDPLVSTLTRRAAVQAYGYGSADPANQVDPTGWDSIESFDAGTIISGLQIGGPSLSTGSVVGHGCNVTSFTMTSLHPTSGFARFTAEFEAMVGSPSNRSNCRIDQIRKYQVAVGTTVRDSGGFITDTPEGSSPYWWDGNDWNMGTEEEMIYTEGVWTESGGGDRATWADAPGWTFTPRPQCNSTGGSGGCTSYPAWYQQELVMRITNRSNGSPVIGITWFVSADVRSSNSAATYGDYFWRYSTADELAY
jgi:RHS repeat-associated protein